MEITWLAHSCFRLRSNNITLLTDPFPSDIGASMEGNGDPNIVTVSNSHPNHSHWKDIKSSYQLLDGPGEYAVSGIYIRGILTPGQPDNPTEHRNTAYFIEMEGLNLCHLGDMSALVTDRQVNELTPVDVLFVPAGGGCTLEPGRLGQVIQTLSPRLVVPMHYMVPGLKIELGSVDSFLREMGHRQEEEPQARLNVTSTNLPAETKVVLLRPTGLPRQAPSQR